MKCELCETLVDDPLSANWYCRKCDSDLLKQGTLGVNEHRTLTEGDPCDDCGGTMVVIHRESFYDRLPEDVKKLRQVNTLLKCVKCGHLHPIFALFVSGESVSVSFSTHPSAVNREDSQNG